MRNQTGASGNIGADAAAKAVPDGYTSSPSKSLEPNTGTPEDLAATLRAEVERWGRAVEAAGVRTE